MFFGQHTVVFISFYHFPLCTPTVLIVQPILNIYWNALKYFVQISFNAFASTANWTILYICINILLLKWDAKTNIQTYWTRQTNVRGYEDKGHSWMYIFKKKKEQYNEITR